jgi:hypothetical protein
MINVYFGSGSTLTPFIYEMSDPKSLVRSCLDVLHKDVSLPIYIGRKRLGCMSARDAVDQGFAFCIFDERLILRRRRNMDKRRMVSIDLESSVLCRFIEEHIITDRLNGILASFPKIRGDLFRALLSDRVALKIICERHKAGLEKKSKVLSRVWECFPYKSIPLNGDHDVVDTTKFSK